MSSRLEDLEEARGRSELSLRAVSQATRQQESHRRFDARPCEMSCCSRACYFVFNRNVQNSTLDITLKSWLRIGQRIVLFLGAAPLCVEKGGKKICGQVLGSSCSLLDTPHQKGRDSPRARASTVLEHVAGRTGLSSSSKHAPRAAPIVVRSFSGHESISTPGCGAATGTGWDLGSGD